MFCKNCNADLYKNHILQDLNIPAMKNMSKIFYPKCSLCGKPICLSDINKIDNKKKVLLITGTAGAGKTALGQLIESRSDYIFIDGDAVQKRVNFFARQNPDLKFDSQEETINTMLILLSLGYNVVVGYIINQETYKKYIKALAQYKITPVFRILVPERSVCLQRDFERECWTAGEKWVDMWFDEMRSFLDIYPSFCIDNSYETLEETFLKHFKKFI